MNRGMRGSHFWPNTKIRKRGIAASQGRRMRGFLKGASGYLVVFFVFSLGYVWTRIQVIETGYRLRNLEVVGEKLKEENRSLMVEAATLRSLQRLERIAGQTGLKRPAEKQIIYIKKELVSEARGNR